MLTRALPHIHFHPFGDRNMKSLRSLFALTMLFLAGSSTSAQELPKPGPEHKELMKMEGNWDATMKMMGMETKCSATYKMDLGGLWLTSTFEGEFAGMKFSGRGMDSYDADKKKYVSVWFDSFSTSPMILEGNFDKEKKTMTLTGEGPGEGGKNTKYKSVTEYKDADTVNFAMYMGDAKEPAFTITYKRKK